MGAGVQGRGVSRRNGARGRSRVSNASSPWYFQLNHILGTGQSLAVGQEGTPALSITQPFSNVMFDAVVNPTVLATLNPLVEVTQESMSSALANLATDLSSDAGITHNALVSVNAVGGAAYAALKQGTAPYTSALAQVTAGRARAAALGKTHGVTAVTVVHGEQDGNEGSLVYDDDIIEWQADYEADIRAITGQSGAIPHFHSQMSAIASSDVPLAQLRAHIAAPGKVILVGPKYHLPTVDGSHLTNEGYRQLGEEYGKAYVKAIVNRQTWEPLRPTALVRAGAVITVTFHVPVAPMAFDTTIVPAAVDMGFEYLLAGVPQGIATVAINGSTVVVTLDANPGGAGRLRYAQVSPMSGNLRDSDATASRHGYSLYNWCVHFDEVVA